MFTSRSHQSVRCPAPSTVRAAVLRLLVALLFITVILTATISGSHFLALNVGMREENFLSDMIVASASIVIHLALERFLRRIGRSGRCLSAYLLFLLRLLFRRN